MFIQLTACYGGAYLVPVADIHRVEARPATEGMPAGATVRCRTAAGGWDSTDVVETVAAIRGILTRATLMQVMPGTLAEIMNNADGDVKVLLAMLVPGKEEG